MSGLRRPRRYLSRCGRRVRSTATPSHECIRRGRCRGAAQAPTELPAPTRSDIRACCRQRTRRQIHPFVGTPQPTGGVRPSGVSVLERSMSWRRCRDPLHKDITDPIRCAALPSVVSGRHAGAGRLSGVLLIVRSVRRCHTSRVPTLRVGVIERRHRASTRDWIPHTQP